MKRILSELYCWFFRHDFVKEGYFDNNVSAFGSYRCIRCGKIHHWQYDK